MRNDTEILEQRNFQVVKSNDLIQRARYDLTVTELKILSFVISKVRPTDQELKAYTFSISEFCKVSGIPYRSGWEYENVKKALKGLRDKSFWFADGTGAEVTCGWLQKVKISKSGGSVTVQLDADMQRFLVGLYANFTAYELISTLPMRSAYSFRIYEILKSYAYTGQHTFDLEDLKRQLGAEHFSNFKDLRRRVLETATKEILLYTDLSVSWEPVKTGKKVTAVKFTIRQRSEWAQYSAAKRAARALDSDQVPGQMKLSDLNGGFL